MGLVFRALGLGVLGLGFGVHGLVLRALGLGVQGLGLFWDHRCGPASPLGSASAPWDTTGRSRFPTWTISKALPQGPKSF